MVALGDSLTAGTQDGVTLQSRQRVSYTQQLADQAGIPYNQPLLTEDGIPPRIWVDGKFDEEHYRAVIGRLVKAAAPLAFYLKTIGIPPDVSRMYKVEGMGRRDPATLDRPERPQHNFAVPGYELRHLTGVGSVRDYLVEMRSGAEGLGGLAQQVPLVHSMLQNDTDNSPGSAAYQAISRDPDVVVLWAGNNDALGTISGVVDDRNLTPLLSQRWHYWDQNPVTGNWSQKTTRDTKPGFLQSARELLQRLREGTHAEIFLFNIPDVTVIPYLRPLGEPVGDLPFRVIAANDEDVTDLVESWVPPTRVKGAGLDGREHFPPGSRVGLVKMMEAFTARGAIRSRADMEERLRELAGQDGLFTEFDVLDAAEVREVSQRIEEFNALLEAEAAGPRVHMIDIHRVLEELKERGRSLRGPGEEVRVTNTFTGSRDRGMDGIFSFDGVHPSDTGHAVLANVLLDRMRTDLGDQPAFQFLREVEPVDEKAAYAGDPHRKAGTFMLTPEAVAVMKKGCLP